MKKLIALAFAASLMLAVGTQAFAQITVSGGLMTNTIGRHQTGTDTETLTGIGLYAGGSYDYALPVKGISVEPGLFLQFTNKYSEDGMDLIGQSPYSTAKFSETALNIPVMVKYTYDAAYVKAGPGILFGLSSKTTAVDTDRTYNHYGNGDFKRFNLYIGAEAGADLGKVTIGLGVASGLLNSADKNYPSDVFLRRTLFYAGLGFKLDNLFK